MAEKEKEALVFPEEVRGGKNTVFFGRRVPLQAESTCIRFAQREKKGRQFLAERGGKNPMTVD